MKNPRRALTGLTAVGLAILLPESGANPQDQLVEATVHFLKELSE